MRFTYLQQIESFALLLFCQVPVRMLYSAQLMDRRVTGLKGGSAKKRYECRVMRRRAFLLKAECCADTETKQPKTRNKLTRRIDDAPFSFVPVGCVLY